MIKKTEHDYQNRYLSAEIILLIVALIILLHVFIGDMFIFRPHVIPDDLLSFERAQQDLAQQEQWKQMHSAPVVFENQPEMAQQDVNPADVQNLSQNFKQTETEQPVDEPIEKEIKKSSMNMAYPDRDSPVQEKQDTQKTHESETHEPESSTSTYIPSIFKKDISQPIVTHEKERTKPDKQQNATRPNNTKMNLAQLTQNYLQHVQQQSNTRISVEGNRTGAATEHQIIFTHYAEKLISCIVNSCRCNKINMPKNRQQSHEGAVLLEINKNGKINRLSIEQSSGNVEIDRFILMIFNDAGSSFPAIPDGLKANILPIKFSYIDIRQFESIEQWRLSQSSK